jgi:type III secretion system YseE family protein
MTKLEDLSDNLSKDPDGSVLKQVQAQLADMLRRIRTAMDAGLTTEKFAEARQLADAVEAADAACVSYWEHNNK